MSGGGRAFRSSAGHLEADLRDGLTSSFPTFGPSIGRPKRLAKQVRPAGAAPRSNSCVVAMRRCPAEGASAC